MSTAESSATQISLPAGTWNVDPVHSSVEFQVKHLGIATVKGHFKEFEGTLEVGPDGARAHGKVNVASVDTREPQRDQHLRSADFFDVENNPEITFQSTSFRQLDEDTYEVEGDFTIHGVTQTLKLNVSLEGTETDPQGNERVGLSATAQISRSDYGMKFNMALGSGNVVVSDKVKILLDVSAVKAAA
ncbi:MAG TPA: YceI family protein [Solirubrobacteraceae bacterium]|jgi:polyisoprenoid-binding protein YceI|nr:YceI family protein [Solirubrobacteraceae bacterium]